jgi:hypothetical protein
MAAAPRSVSRVAPAAIVVLDAPFEPGVHRQLCQCGTHCPYLLQAMRSLSRTRSAALGCCPPARAHLAGAQRKAIATVHGGCPAQSEE